MGGIKKAGSKAMRMALGVYDEIHSEILKLVDFMNSEEAVRLLATNYYMGDTPVVAEANAKADADAGYAPSPLEIALLGVIHVHTPKNFANFSVPLNFALCKPHANPKKIIRNRLVLHKTFRQR